MTITNISFYLLSICVAGYSFSVLKTPNVFRSTMNNMHTLRATDVSVDADVKQEKEFSFVNDDLRPYAMKLHTKQQAPREGQAPAPAAPQVPYDPTRANYLSFLVDSLKVYETFEEIIKSDPLLKPFETTGLDRSEALKEDLIWMLQYDSSLTLPGCGEAGMAYSNYLKELKQESMQKFMCHYYNHYFAHTAGGLMIGKRFSTKLLEGHTLKFYQWGGQNVKDLLNGTKQKVDVMATTWTEEEKQECREESMSVFKYSGGLMVYFRGPQ
jgi:heme oxygenase